jgi:predicted glycoside hydrolase/deacetylase ChbG (UPF0249 family)
MRTLIVNADDFGLSPCVNDGVLQAHVEGIVTSASLMVRRRATVHAVAAANDFPGLSLGLHVDLGEWGYRDGEWSPFYVWAETSDEAAVAAELESQVATFVALVGRNPTHLDSHQHVHLEEPARSLIGAMARELGVPLRHRAPIHYCGRFYGQTSEGHPLPEAITPAVLVQLICELPDGITELGCHPASRPEPGFAYGLPRVIELASLCNPSVRQTLDTSGVRLASFADLHRVDHYASE